MDLSIQLETEQDYINGLLHLRDVCLTEWKFLFPNKVNIDQKYIDNIRNQALEHFDAKQVQTMTDNHCGFVAILQTITNILVNQKNQSSSTLTFQFNIVQNQFKLPNDFMDHMIAYATAQGIQQKMLSLVSSSNYIYPTMISRSIH